MDFKWAPTYAKMVEEMLCKTNLENKSSLECQWEFFKQVICSCVEECFAVKHKSKKSLKKGRSRKRWFDMECKEAQNYLMSLDAHKDKEDYQKHLHVYNALIQKKRRSGNSIDNCFMLKRKHMHVVSFGEI